MLHEDFLLASSIAQSENSPSRLVGMVVQDATGKIQSCNAAAAELLGLTIDQLVGYSSVDPTWQTIRADGSPFPGEQHPAMVTLRSGVSCNNVLMGLYRPDGEFIWLVVSSQPLFTSGQKSPDAVISTFYQRDSDAPATAQDQEQVAELDAIYATAPVGLGFVDTQLRYVRVNQRLADMNGIPVEAHIGRTFRELIPDVASTQDAICQQVIETGLPVLNLEAHGTTPAEPGIERSWLASYYPLRDSAGTILGVNFVVQEITDRVRAEKERDRIESELLESQLIYRNMADAMPQIFWTAYPDGWLDYYNQRWFDYTGMNFEQTQGWGWKPVLHPDDLQKCIDTWNESIQTGKDYQMEYRFRRASDGQYRWHLGRAFPLRDQSGQIVKWFGSNTDIHEQKQAIEEREQALERERAARAELEKASRIKDEFLAVLSHELRSPLNPILGWAKLLRTRKPNPETLDRALDTIERNAKLQSQLVEDLLDVSRILRGKLALKLTSVNLITTIEAALETVKTAAVAKQIQIEKHFEPNVGRVSGDFNRLQQVMWNLLTNAVKFTPDGGQITIALSTIVHNNEPFAQVSVRDTGKGIAADFLPHVFDQFRQADSSTTRQFGGLGLGLAIVRHIVEMHNGTITAESDGLDQGATFTVMLPLMVTSHDRTADPQNPSPLESAPLAGLKILVVDDEADARDLLKFLLEQYGAAVQVASSAAIALEQLSVMKPDLIVSDLGMPDIDGYQFIQRVRSLPCDQGGETPAIAVTAYAREEDRMSAIAAGFQAYITKPIDPLDVVKTIAQLSAAVRSAKQISL